MAGVDVEREAKQEWREVLYCPDYHQELLPGDAVIHFGWIHGLAKECYHLLLSFLYLGQNRSDNLIAGVCIQDIG